MSDNVRKLPRSDTWSIWSYDVLPDRTARITACKFESDAWSSGEYAPVGTLTIPEFVGEGRKRIPVSELSGLLDTDGVSRIVIPDSVSIPEGNPFFCCSAVEEVSVSPNHPTLMVVDGQLISKPDKRLIYVPESSGSIECRVADGVEILGDRAFGCNLQKIILPASVKEVRGNPFFDAIDVHLELSDGQTALVDEDGVLFSTDRKTLLRYPAWKPECRYRIPEGTQEIAGYAFNEAEALEQVTMPDSVTKIGYGAFIACTGLAKIRLSENLEEIPTRAFAFTALKRIAIPAGVKVIDHYAFPRELQELIVLGGETHLLSDALSGLSRNCLVRAPKGSRAEKACKAKRFPFSSFEESPQPEIGS